MPPRPGAAASAHSHVDVAYLTRYVGKRDSGIAFADEFYIRALGRSPLSTLVLANGVPPRLPDGLVRYTSRQDGYREQRPLVHLVNGLGSYQAHARDGYPPEHSDSLKFAFIHDEPAAYDIYDTELWNRDNVVNNLMAAQDGYIFVSHLCQQQWNQYPHIAQKPQFYLPNTCAEEEYIAEHILGVPREEVRADLGYDEDEVNLVVVATVQPRKGQAVAARALGRLLHGDPSRRYRLWLVGRASQPAYRDELVAEATAAGIADRITVVGEVDKAEALRHTYAADLLLCTSESEAMPLVLLEAMQLGTAIVSTGVGGIREIVDDSTACLVPVGDEAALATAVRAALDDAGATAARTRRAAARYWAEFCNERFSERFDRILAEMVELSLQRQGGGFPGSTALELGDDGNAMMVTLHGTSPDGGRSDRLALLRHGAGIDRAQVKGDGEAGLGGLLSQAAPLLRMGLQVSGVDPVAGLLRLERGPVAPLLSADEAALLIGGRDYLSAYEADTRRRINDAEARRRREVAARERAARIERGKAREIARMRRSARWRLGSLLLWPATVARRGLTRRLATARQERRRRRLDRLATVPATVLVFNSPMQMFAGLALWDAKYRPDGPQVPLVAAVYSTGGASDFAATLVAMARRTGRFAQVVDITPTYAAIYDGKPTVASLERFEDGIHLALAPYAAQTLLIAAFMSARAQKMLYEVFAGATIRLFEDGIGSYVPKRVKLTDNGLLDRVTSGDCAEAAHISAVTSVDLMLDSLEPPPQYQGEHESVRYPQLSVADYSIDYRSVAAGFGVRPRPFDARTAVVVLQNFSDHLRRQGVTPAVERRMNDTAIARLVGMGLQVVIRPHPRASTEMWSRKWAGVDAVSVWTDEPGLPVEALIDPDAPPALLVGVSSSCLFYLDGRYPGMQVFRYDDELVEAVERRATREYAQMLQIARAALPPLGEFCGDLLAG